MIASLEAIPSAVTEAEAAQLQALAGGCRVLELGAHYGRSTIALAQTAAIVHSVDWHQGDEQAGSGDSLPTFRENLRQHGVSNVVVHVGRFEDVLPAFHSRWFDGCFLDGQHDQASVVRDTNLALRLVKPGGWFAWHDYGRFEVAPVVNQLAAARGRELGRIEHLAWVRLP